MPTKIAEFSVISVSSPLSCSPLSPSPQHITARTHSISTLLSPSIPWDPPPRSSPPPIQYIYVWSPSSNSVAWGRTYTPTACPALGLFGGISSCPRREMLSLCRARR